MGKRKTLIAWLLGSVLCLCAQALGNDQVELNFGHDGFIFEGLSNLFQYDSFGDMPARRAREYDVLGSINQELRKRGTQLSIVLVPMAERLLEDKLPTGFKLPKAFRSSYQEISEKLTHAGILVPDINAALQKLSTRVDAKYPIWMRQDNHWSPVGALEAARVVSAAIKNRFAKLLGSLPETKYQLGFKEPHPYSGNYFNRLSEQQKLGLAQDWIREPTFTSQSPAMDLLGDSSAGIVAVGTSFSSYKPFGFVDGLAHGLSREVINVAQPGRGFWPPMADYLASNDFQHQAPKLLIWEIPERFFMTGYPPLDFTDDWSYNQFLLELGANLGGDCMTGIGPQAIDGTDFVPQNAGWAATATREGSALKFVFKEPLRTDQYISLQASSQSVDSFFLEMLPFGRPARYYSKLNAYGAVQRINVPLATIADGSSRTVSLKTAPGADFRVSNAKLCSMPASLTRLLKR